MNLLRGLRRLWLALSLCWVVVIGGYAVLRSNGRRRSITA
jgi:hypothetical protein